MSAAFCLVSERTPVAWTLEITLFNKERESCSGGISAHVLEFITSCLFRKGGISCSSSLTSGEEEGSNKLLPNTLGGSHAFLELCDVVLSRSWAPTCRNPDLLRVPCYSILLRDEVLSYLM